MEFDLIAIDLDGTALQDDRASFSPRLDKALNEAHQRSIAIVPVTGRQFSLLPPAVGLGNEWENLAVLCNGGEVRRIQSGELLASHYLSIESILPLVKVAERMGLPIELSSEGILYLTSADWEKQRHLGTMLFHLNSILSRFGCAVDDLSAFCLNFHGHFEKVNLPYVPDELRELTVNMLAELPISAVWSSANGMEITHRDATKANGLITVCRLLGIDPTRTLAIGDSGNDIPMLRAAGLGVAMGNAPDYVHFAAGAVTASNMEDGAAIAIERYVLNAPPLY